MQFRIRFLQQKHPQLIVVPARKYRRGQREAREVIVEHDFAPLSVLAHFDHVDALVVVGLSDEESFHQIGHFREGGAGAEEPAVAQFALEDVCRLDHLLEDLGLAETFALVGEHKVAGSAPVDHSVEGLALFGVENGGVSWGEGDIDERFSVFADLSQDLILG